MGHLIMKLHEYECEGLQLLQSKSGKDAREFV
jgi:hypothetical protein